MPELLDATSPDEAVDEDAAGLEEEVRAPPPLPLDAVAWAARGADGAGAESSNGSKSGPNDARADDEKVAVRAGDGREMSAARAVLFTSVGNLRTVDATISASASGVKGDGGARGKGSGRRGGARCQPYKSEYKSGLIDTPIPIQPEYKASCN